MRYGDFLSSLSLASSHSGDFPVQSSTWQWRSRPGQPAQAARPNIRVYGACAVCRCVLVRIILYGGVFMRDSGRSLQVVHYYLRPESQLETKNSALAMMKL